MCSRLGHYGGLELNTRPTNFWQKIFDRSTSISGLTLYSENFKGSWGYRREINLTPREAVPIKAQALLRIVAMLPLKLKLGESALI